MNTDLVQQNFIKLIDLNYVEFLSWNFDKGHYLRYCRGILSAPEVVSKLKAVGFECSEGAIVKLEKGRAKSISPIMLLYLCYVLCIDINKFYPTLEVSPQSANFLYHQQVMGESRLTS